MISITKRGLASLVPASAIVATLAVTLSPAGAMAAPTSTTGRTTANGYNAIPAKVTGNVPSYGFQAYSIKEIGDIVGLDGARKLSSMSVVFSSWASESGSWSTGDAVTTPGATFNVPITFNIYANNAGTKGALLATKTKDVAIAYRPSTSDLCEGGRWYNSKDGHCYNGMIQMVTMPMPNVTLPEQVIWTVQYNTSTHGPNPTGVSGPADSLNVGVMSYPDAPFIGTDVNEDQAFVDSTYLDGTIDFIGYRPLGAITTK